MSFFSELDAASRTAVDSRPIIHRHFGIPSILEPDSVYEASNPYAQFDDEDDLVSGYVDGENEVGDFQEPSVEEDDDPVCICGCPRSEHQLCGCGEGFQTASAWAREREMIRGMSEDEYEQAYHPEDAWW